MFDLIAASKFLRAQFVIAAFRAFLTCRIALLIRRRAPIHYPKDISLRMFGN
jgi:hypothetical protein